MTVDNNLCQSHFRRRPKHARLGPACWLKALGPFRLMDCYFYQYIPTEAKTPSPDEINKLQLAAQGGVGDCHGACWDVSGIPYLRACGEVPFGAALLLHSGLVCWPVPESDFAAQGVVLLLLDSLQATANLRFV